MTTWTTISNAAVAVGGIPSSTTVTALRDNPIAMSEAANGAPVIVSGWHPVDKVTVGDGKVGLIYDWNVNGTVASIVTPDFVDGYEYRLVADSLVPTANAGFVCDVWGDTSAAYADILGGDGPSLSSASIEIDFPMARLSKLWHGSPLLFARGSSRKTLETWSLYGSSGPQKILRVRLRFASGSIDVGRVWLFRRREYASAP